MRNEDPKSRWLIFRNGAVGDTVLLSSVIQKIRSFSPGAWIEVMGIQERVALLVGSGGADRAVSSEMPGIESLYGTGPVQGSFREYLELFTHILWYSAGDTEILHPRIQQRPEQFVSVFPALPSPDYDGHAIQHYVTPLQSFCADSCLPHPAIAVDPHAVELKRLPQLSHEQIKAAFAHPDLHIFSDAEKLEAFLQARRRSHAVLALMSSGSFKGLDLESL